MTNKPVTNHLTRWLINEVGLRETVRVLETVAMWGIARKQYPEGLTFDGFQDYWEQSTATRYRYQRRFFDAFGDRYESPDTICDALEAEWPSVFAGHDIRATASDIAGSTL